MTSNFRKFRFYRMQLSPQDIEQVVLGVKKGDKKAFEILYEKYSAALYGSVLRIVISEEVANEVLQEIFVKIWKNIQSYDKKKATIFTWMLNIARNSAIDRYRKIKKEHNVPLQVAETVDTGNVRGELNVDYIGVSELISQLTPDQKLVLDYLYFKGYTQQELSDELEIPLGTVKTRARSAINELRKLMNL